MSEPAARIVVGRYELHAPIARGGMATIHLARLHGAEGFCRIVAAKRLHPHLTEDAQFLEMFLDEARIASKIHHPNVVPVLDVVHTGTEVILVQEYVHGVPLDKLLRAMIRERAVLPVEVVVAIVSGVLAGLEAAHEARDELGAPLGIVHRDVSPQNILVGVDGTSRVLDFGVAKAQINAHVTRAGVFKGKIAYSSPEMFGGTITKAIDLHAAAVVCWEALACRRLYQGLSETAMMAAITAGAFEKLTHAVEEGEVPPERWEMLKRIEPVLCRAMSLDPKDRHASAAEMQEALLAAAPAASPAEVARWVKQLGKEYLEGRERLIATEESSFRKRRAGAPAAPVAEPSVGSVPSTASPPSEPAASIQASVLPPTMLSVQPPSRSHRALVGALIVAGGLCVGLAVLLLQRPVAQGPAAGAARGEMPPPPPSASPASVPLREVPLRGGAVEDAAAPSASAQAADGGPRSGATAAVSAAPAARARVPVERARLPAGTSAPATAAPPAAPAPDCDPPFTFDGKKKIFKPGCL